MGKAFAAAWIASACLTLIAIAGAAAEKMLEWRLGKRHDEMKAYQIVVIQIVATVAFALVFVPIHELGHVLLGYALGQRPIEIVWFNFQFFTSDSITNTIEGQRDVLGWVIFDSSSVLNLDTNRIQNFYYHIFIYAVESMAIVSLNAKILRRYMKP